MTRDVDEIHSAGVIVLTDEMVHCIRRGPKKHVEFAKTRLLEDEAFCAQNDQTVYQFGDKESGV